MNIRKKNITILIILLVLLTVLVRYGFFNSEKLKPQITITSTQLLKDYLINEKEANNLYNNKAIKITGIVKEITYLNQRNTIFLDTKHKSSNIICDLNDSEKKKLDQIKAGQKITIIGICKGFLKDIIILNCDIQTKQKNE